MMRSWRRCPRRRGRLRRAAHGAAAPRRHA